MLRKLLIPVLLAGLLPVAGCCCHKDECPYENNCPQGYSYGAGAPAGGGYTETLPPAAGGSEAPGVPAPGVDAPPQVPSEKTPAPKDAGTAADAGINNVIE